jgi:hypothetical protein
MCDKAIVRDDENIVERCASRLIIVTSGHLIYLQQLRVAVSALLCDVLLARFPGQDEAIPVIDARHCTCRMK